MDKLDFWTRYIRESAETLRKYGTRIMMTSSNGNIFRVTGPLCGEFTGPGEFPTQRPVTRSFDVICVWINGWVNNCEAGDLRRNRVHYDVIVMIAGQGDVLPRVELLPHLAYVTAHCHVRFKIGKFAHDLMTSSNGIFFRVICPL